MPTQYQFTGQYRQAAIGLDYFNARWYDPALGRFAQADTVIPEASQGVQAWDRFAGMNNNPARFTDPTGHDICGDDYDPGCINDTPPPPEPNSGDETTTIVINGREYVVPSWVANAIVNGVVRYYVTAWQVDAALYKLPSAFGIQLPSVSGSAIVAGGVSDTYIFNWRSMELDHYFTGEVGAGFPPGASGTINLFSVNGASSNTNFEGAYFSVTVSGFMPIGGVVGKSYGLKEGFASEVIQSGELQSALNVDSASGKNIVTSFLGAGVGSPGISGEATFGTTLFKEGIFDLNLPFWIIPPNNPFLATP